MNMQSKAKTVDAYLKEVPQERKEVLAQIRDAFLNNLKGYEECMEYGGPCYKKDGEIEAGFMGQARSINIYILKQDVMKKNKDLLKGLSVGKGVHTVPKSEEDRFEPDCEAALGYSDIEKRGLLVFRALFSS